MAGRDAARAAALSGALVALSAACGRPASLAATAPVRERHVASQTCPLKTPAAWRSFMTSAVDDESWVKTCSAEGNCDALDGFTNHVRRDVVGVLASCAADIAENPRIERCTARLRRFVPAWLRQHDTGSYGFTEENSAYLAAQTAPDRPAGMMEPPPAIVAALPDRHGIEEAARVNGWPFLTHDSCFGDVRTFVTVADPKHRFDQWFLVRYDRTASRVPENSVVSFIAVQKKDATGRDLPRVRLHFRDYIAWNAGSSWRLALPEVHDGKCYACHPSGMRLLVPTHGTVAASAPVNGESAYADGNVPVDFGYRRLSELNARLLAYGLPDWTSAVDPSDAGPPLGDSLGCTACHDGATRGILSVYTDVGTFRRKIVDELAMQSYAPGKEVPDEAAMSLLDREPRTPAESAALARARSAHLADYQAFMASRLPTWRAWVLGNPCE